MKKWYKLLKAYDGFDAQQVIELEEDVGKSLVAAGVAEETSAPETKGEDLDSLKKDMGEYIAESVKDAVKGIVTSARNSPVFVTAIDHEDEKCGGFKNFGQFALAVKQGQEGRHTKSMVAYSDRIKAATGANEGAFEDGGALVPTDISDRIFEKVFNEDAILSLTDQQTVSGNSISFKSVREDSRKDGFRHGGIQARWLGEAALHTKTDKVKWDDINLRLNKLGVFAFVTDEQLADASGINLAQFLAGKASQAINFSVTDSLINGDGVSKPLGVLNSGALVTISRGTASEVHFDDVLSMWNRFDATTRSNAVWLYNQDVEPWLYKLHGEVKTGAGAVVGGWPVFMPPGGISGAQFGTLFGRPVMPVEQCPALGSTGDFMLVDWSSYITAVKGGITSSMSIHLRFDYDETAFKFIFRIDGQPWWKLPVTSFKGSTTRSPFIALA